MTMEFGDLAGQVAGDGAISAQDILELRRLGWADGRIDPDEAEWLFSANDACTEPSREWCDFFVEALSTYIVHTVEPHGYVDEEMAEELIARIDRDGRVETLAELELLVRVAEIALNVPDSFKAYALRQIEDLINQGEGLTRQGTLSPHGVNAAECAILRRLIFAPAGEHSITVGQREAEMLFRIKDATLYEVNDPEWEKLFVQGVANYLFSFDGHEPLSNERAAELERFMTQECAGVGIFLARMINSKPDGDGAFASLLDISPHCAEPDEQGAQEQEQAELSAQESHWLTDMLEADEELDPMEKALIAWIAQETGELFGMKV